ncbi:MAG: hypothetical protein AUJ49_09715 [Desulfovibrionaceae bacterium CG1_02_65_16]|nr:MAG: hypothetical protein AUJ49_09715 [Desulfovibrionaceae bacterium CG1_02_65_16]
MLKRKPPIVIIAADVFGVTPELGQLVQALGITEATFVSPHPFTRTFRSEAEGYASFMAAGGVEAYAGHLGRVLAARDYTFDFALGFSAGASALWLRLADAALEPRLPGRAILYYGSRIRDDAHLRPRRQTRLVFAEREASFDPAPLAQKLRAAGNDAVLIPGSAHGFMNPRSPGYDAAISTRELAALRAQIHTPPPRQ